MTRWRLRAWTSGAAKKDRVLIHDSTCVGDAELDQVLKSLECRPDFGRAGAELERATFRLPYEAPILDRRSVQKVRAEACDVCEMPEPECRRRERTSGHTFTLKAAESGQEDAKETVDATL